jgi:predicted porin
MKTPFKLASAAMMIIAGTISVKAQTSNTSGVTKGIRYNVGIESGIAAGGMREAYTWSQGASLQADIPIANQFFLTINSGYQHYSGKGYDPVSQVNNTDLHIIPLKAGLKFFPVQQLYIQGEAGADYALNERFGAFVYAPQLGYQFKFKRKSLIETGVRYERATNKFIQDADATRINVVALRAAYFFSKK